VTQVEAKVEAKKEEPKQVVAAVTKPAAAAAPARRQEVSRHWGQQHSGLCVGHALGHWREGGGTGVGYARWQAVWQAQLVCLQEQQQPWHPLQRCASLIVLLTPKHAAAAVAAPALAACCCRVYPVHPSLPQPAPAGKGISINVSGGKGGFSKMGSVTGRRLSHFGKAGGVQVGQPTGV
jgi:hypothetical protein